MSWRDYYEIGQQGRFLGQGDYTISREQWERACARSHKKARMRKGKSRVTPEVVSLLRPPWEEESK